MKNKCSDYRHYLIIIISIVFLLWPGSYVVSQEGKAIIEVDAIEGVPGDTVEVSVSISNPGGMSGGSFALSYDPVIVKPIDISDDGILSGTWMVPNLEYQEDKLKVAWFGLKDIEDDGEFVSIDFNLKETGETALRFHELSLVDGEGAQIDVEVVNGSIKVSENGTVAKESGSNTGILYYVVLAVLFLLLVGVVLFYRYNKLKDQHR